MTFILLFRFIPACSLILQRYSVFRLYSQFTTFLLPLSSVYLPLFAFFSFFLLFFVYFLDGMPRGRQMTPPKPLMLHSVAFFSFITKNYRRYLGFRKTLFFQIVSVLVYGQSCYSSSKSNYYRKSLQVLRKI